MSLVEKAKAYAISRHNATNQMYGDKPYSYHLKKVYGVALRYIELIPENMRDIILASCFTHDLIEDCRESYLKVLRETNKEVAEITFALTMEKGRTRKEKMNDRYFQGILDTPHAVFVKLCDRIANIEESLKDKKEGKKTSKLKMYMNEHEKIKKYFGIKAEYLVMLDYIDLILKEEFESEK